MALRLEIVTPDSKTFSDDVDQVVLPGIEGEFGVLPGHAPFVTQITHGELVVTQGSEQHYLAVGDGFVEVKPDSVSVLTDMALMSDDINEQEVEAALKRAEEALAQKQLTPDESAAAMAILQKSIAQLHVKRRRRSL